MSAVELKNPTNYQDINKVLQGIISIFEAMFPGKIRSYYVVGSYAYGYAVPGSDIDMWIIFRESVGDDDLHQARSLRRACQLMAPVNLDIDIIAGPPYNIQPYWANISTQVKTGGLLLYGEDIQADIPMIPIDDYARYLMHFAALRVVSLRNSPPLLRYPIDYPRQDDRFYGYVPARVDAEGAKAELSTRGMIGCMTNMTNALVAFKGRSYVQNKAHCFTLHKECINDEWSDFLIEAFTKCNTLWKYRVPEDPEAQVELSALCRKMLDYENHFLAAYREFLLAELSMSQEQATNLLIVDILEMLDMSDQEIDVIISGGKIRPRRDPRGLWSQIKQLANMVKAVRSQTMAAQLRTQHLVVSIENVWRMLALRQLGRFIFDDQAIVAALTRLTSADDRMIQRYAQDTIARYTARA